ncbi:MAG: histidinol dehydrogenase, partial [Acidimicrobiia bacterium]
PPHRTAHRMTDLAITTVEISTLDAARRAAITHRSPVPDAAVRIAAARIVDAVRRGGDASLQEAGREFGGGSERRGLRIDRDRCRQALRDLDDGLRSALETAMAHIIRCHEVQRPRDQVVSVVPGVFVERKWAPLDSVGVYVPGGRAPYPSSLLMGVVPALIAGVTRVAVATPADDDGEISPVLLAAAELAGVEEIYAMGGAQAVAALAYGTESVARVAKIVGPGNAWVTAAKLAVVGDVAIDLPAGPSESLTLADSFADPTTVAADMLCQAEHGPESPTVLVTTDAGLARKVVDLIGELLPGLERNAIVTAALRDAGLVAIARDMDEALDFVNEYASEHVAVDTRDAPTIAARITNAGSVFVGRWSPHSAGDYATGGNHVLPTGGLARSHGPLSVEDFGSWRQIHELTCEGLAELQPTIAAIAGAEGLSAHDLAVRVRFENAGR